MNFAETMTSNPPRLVVLYQDTPDHNGHFQWGLVGAIPILSLIGHIVSCEVDLVNDEWMQEADHNPPCFVIAWDADERMMTHFLSSEIPREALAGMMETIKAMLVDSRLAQQQAAQRVEPPILGPDGKPIRR